MIRIHHDKPGTPYVCIDCCGIEDVIIKDKNDMWKHLEDYHNWPATNKEFLTISEDRAAMTFSSS